MNLWKHLRTLRWKLLQAYDKLTVKYDEAPKTWFTSDLHFGHGKIIYYCDRPYTSVTEMTEAIVRQWNKQVAPHDVVYVLGDFSLSPKWSTRNIKRLNGQKILVSGNHDVTFPKHKGSDKMIERYKRDGWSDVKSNLRLSLSGRTFNLSHLPPLVEGYDARYKDLRPTLELDVVYLHGHLHNRYKRMGNLIDVGFDVELRLFSLDDVMKILDGPWEQAGRPIKPKDDRSSGEPL